MSAQDELPPERTLALAYARPCDRPAFEAFFRLDLNLGRAVALASEPIVGQLRLAWWRDALGAANKERPHGNPLLDAILGTFGRDAGRLLPLVDGWEAVLLAERLGEGAIEPLLQGRSEGWLALASRIDCGSDTQSVSSAARRWALADLLTGLSEESERASVLAIATPRREPVRLSRPMRPLAVLAALSERTLVRGGGALLGDRMAALVALRSGLFGR